MSTNTRGREKPTDSVEPIAQTQTPYCGPDESAFFAGESIQEAFRSGRWILTDHSVEVKE